MKSRRRLCFIAWGTVALYVLIAVCLTHMPKPPSNLEPVGDKSLHMIGYGFYAAVIYVACIITWPQRRGFPLIVMLILAVWAALDEITQPWFHRTCDIMDWRADMIGALVAVALLSGLRWVTTRGRLQAA